MKTDFIVNLNELGHEQKRSAQAPRHVTLGSYVLEKVDPLEPSKRIQGERFLGRGATWGALRPRLGLAWPG